MLGVLVRSCRMSSTCLASGRRHPCSPVRWPLVGRAASARRSRAVNEGDEVHQPVSYDHHAHVTGPFFHGTKAALEPGDELVPGCTSNFQEGRVSNNIYFTTLLGTAAWGAELATALSGGEGRGHIYVVEPMGPFEDDPNVTNK